jgi:rhomboid family GlyGly-CTERM serine protease
MGLLQDRHSWLARHRRQVAYWAVPLVIATVSSVAALAGNTGREVLRYDRLAIQDGEFWRLVSGHFVHLGLQHLLLNFAGLVLVWLLVGRQYTIRQWWLVIAISLAVIDLGFWYLDTGLHWYVGLSGLLHGLLLAGAIAAFRSMPAEAAIICVALVGKLVYEQLMGPLPGSEATAGGAVITNAHLFGAVGGALGSTLLWRSVRPTASI